MTAPTAGVFAYDPNLAAQLDPTQAIRLLEVLAHPGQPIHLQVFADGPHELYHAEQFTRKDGSPGTALKYKVTGWPKAGGKTTSKQGGVTTTRNTTLEDLPKVLGELWAANFARCGLFFAVNALEAGENTRRSNDTVAQVRALFVDLDGAPLPPRWAIEPTAIVESSPGRFHVYWAAADIPLNRFTAAQQQLARLFGGDVAVCDLARVMRLPGMAHNKAATPFVSKLLSPDDSTGGYAPTYTFDELTRAFDLTPVFAAQDEADAARLEAARESRARAEALRAELSSGKASDREAVQQKYAQAALLDEIGKVSSAQQGSRNNQVFKSAAALGEFEAAGALSLGEIQDELTRAALSVGLDEHEAQTTIEGGLARGRKNPRDLSNVGKLAGKKKRTDTPRLDPAPAPAEAAPAYGLPSFPKGTQEGTDEANAVILAANGLGARLRYSVGLGWFVYLPTEGRWKADPELIHAAPIAGDVLRAVVGQYLADAIKQRADEDELKRVGKWAAQVCNVGTVGRALQAAAGKPEFLTPAEAWDAAPQLLNCQNGVLDLASGELLPHDPAHLMTWQAGAAYDPSAQHPYVDQLLDLLRADGRYEFLQRLLGSCLYGEAPNEKINVLHGPGGTGKGTFTDGAVAALGDYAGTIDINLLLNNPRGEAATGPKPELLMLRGKRLVVAGEPPQGARFNAGRIKGMSGNDPITARNMHSPAMVTFAPVFKLWIHTNYDIGAAHDDTGLQRRISVIPFTAKPSRANPDFKRTLKHDPQARSALLNWAAEGCRLWLASGYDLGESEAIAKATGNYWEHQNPYKTFAAERLVFGSDYTLPSPRLKAMFEEWAEENGAKMGRAVKMADLYAFLQTQGCEAGRTKSGRFWYGVTEVTEVTPLPEFFPNALGEIEKTGEQVSPASPASPNGEYAPSSGELN